MLHDYLCRNMSCMTYLQYPLYTIMVFDEWRNGIPVAWFIMSSSKEEDLTPVLTTLMDKMVAAMPTWKSCSIIVDNAQAEINAIQ
jgi:hypothetical protein